MLTDWVLIGRVAHELRERLGGARVTDAGLLPDGRLGIVFRSHGRPLILALDPFAATPLVTLESGELGIAVEPGFARTLARSLVGTTLADVSARRDDRLLRLGFGSRSRFGVGDRLDLYVELVPRFGNAVLVKDDRVVAAYKEFSPVQNAQRTIAAGSPYVLPPLPPRPPTLAVQPPGTALDYFAQLRERQSAADRQARTGVRRRALLRRLSEQERKLRDELKALDAKRRRAHEREALRSEGEDIFATLHTLDATAQDAAKQRAVELFGEYKRLGKSLPHIALRERALRERLEAVETLRWEAERAADEDVEAVETAAQFGPKRTAPPSRQTKRKRPPLEFRTALGSRILVGRSPAENADLTFRVARPGDLWFHARGIPGAHVILARDDRQEPPGEDVALAASLAAFHSRGRNSPSVPIDYTHRKHVRKQRAAPPGLVWYTNAKTIAVPPREGPVASPGNHSGMSHYRSEEAVT